MVQHIVMWNLKNDVDKPAVISEMKEKLEGLLGYVSGLKSIQVSPCFAGYDVVLVCTCENKDKLEAYQNHPKHVAIKEYISTVAQSRAFCDAEI